MAATWVDWLEFGAS